MRLDNNLALQTSIAALLVTSGVVTKNSFEQLGVSKDSIGNMLAVGLFGAGWGYMAYILSLDKPNKMLFILPSIGIVVSVLMMKQYMAKKQTPPMMYPILFALSWLILGFGVSNHLPGNLKYIGLIASVLVLASMMAILPLQRKYGVVDGPGMPLFVIAWVIIVFINSSR